MIDKGIYRHFKGDEVEVIGQASHSETFEDFVVYRHLAGRHAEAGRFWVRPLSMFTEEVDRDGKKQPRFQLIKKIP